MVGGWLRLTEVGIRGQLSLYNAYSLIDFCRNDFMVLTETPICDFGKMAPDFEIKDCFGNIVTRDSLKGSSGLLVMFICNHCPYVKAILPRLTQEIKKIQELGFGCVAISSNDTEKYPEDNLENMQKVAKEYAFSFPYCLDETQQIAKDYEAVCTPDFFGYDANLGLQYRGRFDSSGRNEPKEDTQNELLDAMIQIANTGQGPKHQIASMGCSIKWK